MREVIDHWADRDPDMLAMYWVDDKGNELKRSFADIRLASKRLCNVLTGAGVKRGDTVILVLGRNPEWWDSFTAVLRMGAVISPGTTQLSAKDLQYRIDAAQAVCVITDAANCPKVEKIAEQCKSLKVKILLDGECEGWISYDTAIGRGPRRV